MTIPNNGLIQRDGRIGPFWEYYILVAPPLFWYLKIAWVYGWAEFWSPYKALVAIVPIALILHLMDKKANRISAIEDEIDQTVPLWHKILGIIFGIALGITVIVDYRAVSAQAHFLRDSQSIVDSVPLKES